MRKGFYLLLFSLVLTGCFGEKVEEKQQEETKPPIEEEKKEGKMINVPEDYQTIQAAIESAEEGDEIWVAEGTYNEDIDFMGKNIKLYGGFAGELVAENHIIKGTGSGPVVRIDKGETSEAVLAGFTITGGDYSHGGGLIIGSLTATTSPTIMGNIFVSNQATYGGGIYVHLSNSEISNNEFIDNESLMSGGGIHVSSQGLVTIDSNSFENNKAGTFGGGLLIGMSNPVVKNNYFIKNKAVYGGGAISISEDSSPELDNNSFNGNTPDDVN